MPTPSLILQYAPADPRESANVMHEKLRHHADAADVAADLAAGVDAIVVVDARSADYYVREHIPGAISFPHRQMTDETVRKLDRDKVYVVYCDGIGCNASTKGAYKLATLGFAVKELIGGLDFWKRDGHPVATGTEAGSLREAPVIECAC